MDTTIMLHNGSKVAREHNRRNPKVVSKESHIREDGEHINIIDRPLLEVYDEIFGEALAEYNAKQTREDRKIKNYLHHIEKDAKKHSVYEAIVTIGNKENPIPIPLAKEIYKEYFDSWQKRNPSLILCGLYFHADEQGQPHCHADYVPRAEGYKKGLRVQNGLAKALQQMGFEKKGRETEQIQWERREAEYLEKLCRERGLNVLHPKRERKEYLEKEQYVAEKELAQMREALQKAEADYFEQIDNLDCIIEDKKKEFAEMEKQTPFKRQEKLLAFSNFIVKKFAPERIQKLWDLCVKTKENTMFLLNLKKELGQQLSQKEEDYIERERSLTRSRKIEIER